MAEEKLDYLDVLQKYVAGQLVEADKREGDSFRGLAHAFRARYPMNR